MSRVAGRHEALRTRVVEETRPVQLIEPRPEIEIEVDLSRVEESRPRSRGSGASLEREAQAGVSTWRRSDPCACA